MFPPEFVVAALAKDVMPINLICRKLFAGGNNLAVMANFIDGETQETISNHPSSLRIFWVWREIRGLSNKYVVIF
jgi:hypothetical protein